MFKNLVLAALALGITATAVLANPVMIPVMPVVPHISMVNSTIVSVNHNMLQSYRNLRSFWISKAIVR